MRIKKDFLLQKPLRIAILIALSKLIAFIFVNQFIDLKARNIINYVDLESYIIQGEYLIKHGFIGAVKDLSFLNNPLWSIILYKLTEAFNGYEKLALLSFVITIFRDYLWIKIIISKLGKIRYSFLLLLSPYLFVYTFNFSSDLLGSLAIMLLIYPMYFQRNWKKEHIVKYYSVTTLLLTLFLLIRINFLYIALLSGVKLIYIIFSNWRDLKTKYRLLALFFTVTSIFLGLIICIINLKLYSVFSANSAAYGYFSLIEIRSKLQAVLGSNMGTYILSYFFTSIVHLFSFLFMRESVYLYGINSTLDILFILYMMLLHLPGLIGIIRKKEFNELIIFFLLFLPSLISYSHARYSLPIQPLLLIRTFEAYDSIIKKLRQGFYALR